VEDHRINQLGVSPTLIRSLLQLGEAPVRAHDLSSLRCFASTGEPWNPEPWRWLFDVVGGGRIPIVNYSGGTEISGGIVMGNPLLPLKPCAFSGPCPGIAAAVGKPLAPKVLRFVSDLPRTRNAKVMRRMVRSAYLGLPAGPPLPMGSTRSPGQVRSRPIPPPTVRQDPGMWRLPRLVACINPLESVASVRPRPRVQPINPDVATGVGTNALATSVIAARMFVGTPTQPPNCR
jgi:hypothetical protein